MIMRINFIQQEIFNGTVELKKIGSENEVADILTKPLITEPFEKLREYILTGFDGKPIMSLPSKKPITDRIKKSVSFQDAERNVTIK